MKKMYALGLVIFFTTLLIASPWTSEDRKEFISECLPHVAEEHPELNAGKYCSCTQKLLEKNFDSEHADDLDEAELDAFLDKNDKPCQKFKK